MGRFSVGVEFQVYRMGSSRALPCHSAHKAGITAHLKMAETVNSQLY